MVVELGLKIKVDILAAQLEQLLKENCPSNLVKEKESSCSVSNEPKTEDEVIKQSINEVIYELFNEANLVSSIIDAESIVSPVLSEDLIKNESVAIIEKNEIFFQQASNQTVVVENCNLVDLNNAANENFKQEIILTTSENENVTTTLPINIIENQLLDVVKIEKSQVLNGSQTIILPVEATANTLDADGTITN
jgi:hypothetical protein